MSSLGDIFIPVYLSLTAWNITTNTPSNTENLRASHEKPDDHTKATNPSEPTATGERKIANN